MRIWLCFCPSALRIADSRWPSAVRMMARFSRSAFICRSIASWMDAGGSIALISTRPTRIPQPPVALSSSPRSLSLISSREVSVPSRLIPPTTLRSVVIVICSTPTM